MNIYEKEILTVCAPTILGVKQATLFSCPKAGSKSFMAFCHKTEKLFALKDIYFKPLYQCSERIFVLIYRKEAMFTSLKAKKVQLFLKNIGYPFYNNASDIEKILDFLAVRIALSKSFPHEIGIFLGYPAKDVFGFIENMGKNYKLCGYWKVYDDVKKAEITFKKIDACSEIMRKTVQFDAPLSTVLQVS